MLPPARPGGTLLDQLSAALGTDATRSQAKATTDPQDEKTTQALHTLCYLAQAHYPDAWEDQLRSWSWRNSSK